MRRADRQNLRYVALHKYYVALAGVRLGVSPLRLILHDWTKLLPTEWRAYRDFFYSDEARPGNSPAAQRERVAPAVQAAFDAAWNRHQNAHSHHWQYHVLLRDDGTSVALPMPEADIREMVADWIGAGRMWGGKVAVWYHRNMRRMVLHDDTRRRVEALIGVPDFASYFAPRPQAIPDAFYERLLGRLRRAG